MEYPTMEHNGVWSDKKKTHIIFGQDRPAIRIINTYYKISCEIHKILKLESAENLGIFFRCDFDSEIKLYPHRKFCMKQNPDNDWKRQNNN